MKYSMCILGALVGAAILGGAPSARAGSCCAARPSAEVGGTTLPEMSLYHGDLSWVGQDGHPRHLRDFAGTPVLVSMIFTHCGYACPRTVADLKALRAALPAETRDRVRVVLATFDVERDTPERLRAWASLHELGPEWTLLHGEADAVRELAVMLDIVYQKQPDGSFAHANRIVLLDAGGVPAGAVDGLGASGDALVAKATQLASGTKR